MSGSWSATRDVREADANRLKAIRKGDPNRLIRSIRRRIGGRSGAGAADLRTVANLPPKVSGPLWTDDPNLKGQAESTESKKI